ncbi:hypothetical protein JW935_17680, partial [candidate division KSB1 bacterium]|nr:hypothetical protein [candidate division KSB1 bacterium]
MWQKYRYFQLFFLVVFFQNPCAAQNNADTLSVHVNSIQILTSNYDGNRQKLFDLIAESSAKIKSLVEEKKPDNNAKYLKLTLLVNREGYKLLSENIERFGYIDRKTYEKIDNSDEIGKLTQHRDFLQKQLITYQSELADSKNDKNRQDLWQKTRSIEGDLFHDQSEIKQKLREVRENVYNIEMTEEVYTPRSSGEKGIQFVNMPGAAFAHLQVENPTAGFSAKSYSGWQIKYMFTRGKTYFQFGALSSDIKMIAEEQINELFTYGFGQDFYPRYFGRGKRSYLNLYTGYTIGGFFATTKTASRHKFSVIANF